MHLIIPKSPLYDKQPTDHPAIPGYVLNRMLLEDYVHRQESGGMPAGDDLLSEREQEVLTLCALGHTASQIGDQLALSPKTVETYRTRVMQKLELHSRAELVKYALAHGLLEEFM